MKNMKIKMKLFNSKLLIILFISLIALLFIPIFLEILGYREKMTDYINFSDYNTIDRIKITDTETNTYAYCVGGNISCKSSTASLIDISNENYTGGNTYQPNCNDGDDVICSDNLFNSVSSYNLSSYILPNTTTSFPLSSVYKGFTVPYNYVPIVMDNSSNNFNVLNSSQEVQESIHKCNLLTYENQQNCYKHFFGGGNTSSATSQITSPVTNQSTSSATSQITSLNSATITSEAGKCGDSLKIPCIADFGTNIGDNLCCGQTGVLQNTKYVCPNTRPKCSNFKCGSQFGNCE